MNLRDFNFEEISYLFEDFFNITEDYMPLDTDHKSVLAEECLDALDIRRGGIYVDCTFGAGGHTRRILEREKDCAVIAFDRDPSTQKYADDIKKQFGDRFIFINSRFSLIEQKLLELGVEKVDGFLFDLGFSSMQVDTPRRGFSFQEDGPLDMRMGDDGLTAEELINETSQDELAGIIFKYGDERKSRQIAKAICANREHARITRTSELADIIKKAVGFYNDKIHPATRTFQAIRIAINEEFEEIKIGLDAAVKMLNEKGRLAVMTFHSGEDALVKSFIKNKSAQSETFSRYAPIPQNALKNDFELEVVNKKPIIAGDEELKGNVRARSAKLRVAEKKEIVIN